MGRVCSVGVRAGVDWRAGRREILASSTSGQEDEDGKDNYGDKDQSGDGDTDGKVALREANGRGVVNLCGLKLEMKVESIILAHKFYLQLL